MKIRLVFISLVVLINSLVQAQINIAIADFTNRSSEFYLDTWEKSVPELLKAQLSANDQIRLLERGKLESVLQEQALSMTGLVDSSTAQKVGGLLGAEYIISGSIDQNDDWTILTATLVRVSNGESKVEFVRTANREYLNDMVALLANNLSYTLLGTGRYENKLELKRYPTLYFLAGTAVLGAGTIWAHQQYLKAQDEYSQASRLSDFDDLYNKANTWYQTRDVLAVLSGVALVGTMYCWIGNMNPDVIAAREQNSQTLILPGLQMDRNGNWSAYVAIIF
jgi:TolB-like protein